MENAHQFYSLDVFPRTPVSRGVLLSTRGACVDCYVIEKGDQFYSLDVCARTTVSEGCNLDISVRYVTK